MVQCSHLQVDALCFIQNTTGSPFPVAISKTLFLISLLPAIFFRSIAFSRTQMPFHSLLSGMNFSEIVSKVQVDNKAERWFKVLHWSLPSSFISFQTFYLFVFKLFQRTFIGFDGIYDIECTLIKTTCHGRYARFCCIQCVGTLVKTQ